MFLQSLGPYLATLDYQAIADAINNILAGLQASHHRVVRDVSRNPENTKLLLKMVGSMLSGTPSMRELIQPTFHDGLKTANRILKSPEPINSSPHKVI